MRVLGCVLRFGQDLLIVLLFVFFRRRLLNLGVFAANISFKESHVDFIHRPGFESYLKIFKHLNELLAVNKFLGGACFLTWNWSEFGLPVIDVTTKLNVTPEWFPVVPLADCQLLNATIIAFLSC
jgi:hypothetical protein